MRPAITAMMLILFVQPAVALTISEIMYNPIGDDNNREFIEIYFENPENLSRYIIADLVSNDTLSLLQLKESNYALIVEQDFDFSEIDASVYAAGATIGNNLDNTFDKLFLYTPDFQLAASASYNNSLANGNGKSLELVGGNFIESIEDGGTPGRENTAFVQNTTTEMPACSAEINIKTDKVVYENKEKAAIMIDIDDESFPFIIEYWVEDLAGNIAKPKLNTTNTNQKSWTANIVEEDKSFYAKAVLYQCSQTKQASSLFTVKGDEKQKESEVEIKEILGDAEFGKTIRAELRVYKGDESKSTLEVWLENENGKISEIYNTQLKNKFTDYELTIPIAIGCGEEGMYTLYAKAFDILEEKDVRVEGNCASPASALSPSPKTGKINYLLDFSDKVFVGEEFENTLTIENDDMDHEFAVYSYVYDNSKSLSGEREENIQSVTVERFGKAEVKLMNKIITAESGAYKYKVRIFKDNVKTPAEITKEIIVENKIEDIKIENAEKAVVNEGLLNAVKEDVILESPINITTKIVYESKQLKSKKSILYIILAVMAMMVIVVIIVK